MSNQIHTIRERVLSLLAKKFGLEISTLSNNTHFIEDLHADSLDLVDIGMMIQSEFECEIPDEQMIKISTVEHLVKYLETNLRN